MYYTATITSKRQVTIPATLFKALNLQQGEKVIFKLDKTGLRMESSVAKTKRLAGSLKLPKRFQGFTTQEIIQKAKATS